MLIGLANNLLADSEHFSNHNPASGLSTDGTISRSVTTSEWVSQSVSYHILSVCHLSQPVQSLSLLNWLISEIKVEVKRVCKLALKSKNMPGINFQANVRTLKLLHLNTYFASMFCILLIKNKSPGFRSTFCTCCRLQNNTVKQWSNESTDK